MRTLTSCVSTLGSGGDTPRAEDVDLVELSRQAWTLRVGRDAMTVRPSSARDLAAVAQMHSRCSARSLLDRYRFGGRPPAVVALDHALRRPRSLVVTTADGDIVATGSLDPDPAHSRVCVQVGLLVEDRWQRLGIGSALMSHLAGVAQVAGFTELIAYPATAIAAVQRLMVEVGRTRMVPDVDAHLHTYLPASATLGLGSVRQGLAG